MNGRVGNRKKKRKAKEKEVKRKGDGEGWLKLNEEKKVMQGKKVEWRKGKEGKKEGKKERMLC